MLGMEESKKVIENIPDKQLAGNVCIKFVTSDYLAKTYLIIYEM